MSKGNLGLKSGKASKRNHFTPPCFWIRRDRAELDMHVVHAGNPSTVAAEAGGHGSVSSEDYTQRACLKRKTRKTKKLKATN